MYVAFCGASQLTYQWAEQSVVAALPFIRSSNHDRISAFAASMTVL